MGKKLRDRARFRLSANRVADAMLTRVKQSMAVNGSLEIPAVPSLLEEYVTLSAGLFAAAGRSLPPEELEEIRNQLSSRLREAFEGSQRSKVRLEFRAPAGCPPAYTVSAEVNALASVYEKWLGHGEEPLFGAHPDARVLALASELDPATSPVLDLGAGTGRNALALARLGFAVDAVELTPRFAEILRQKARAEELPVRVIEGDVFRAKGELRSDYALFIASELIPDFRGTAELRSLLALASEVLGEAGQMVFNLHLTAQGYTPERAAREFGQQSYSALFTASEIEGALAGLPFELVSRDSAQDYERKHLPPGCFPPTPWYENWTSGRDVYELSREDCPVELAWLVYRKVNRPLVPARGLFGIERAAHFQPVPLRKALVRRLLRRGAATIELTVPAVPSLFEFYTGMCFSLFSALGREFSADQLAEGRASFKQVLDEAFTSSPRSQVVVSCEAPRGSIGRYTLTADPVPLFEAYEEWMQALPEPLFGEHPDARLLSWIAESSSPGRVLDLGAGLGRNALPLARAGYEVDAIEPTRKFAEALTKAAVLQHLAVRVIQERVSDSHSHIRNEYRLVLASGLAGDFRSHAELRSLFELAAERLTRPGTLLLSVHIAVNGYTPDSAAREWAQQSSAMFFTRAELASALAGLPLELLSDHSSYEYERAHSPEGAFPATEAYPEWALGTHMFASSPDESPIELRWLAFAKSEPRS